MNCFVLYIYILSILIERKDLEKKDREERNKMNFLFVCHWFFCIDFLFKFEMRGFLFERGSKKSLLKVLFANILIFSLSGLLILKYQNFSVNKRLNWARSCRYPKRSLKWKKKWKLNQFLRISLISKASSNTFPSFKFTSRRFKLINITKPIFYFLHDFFFVERKSNLQFSRWFGLFMFTGKDFLLFNNKKVQ